MTRFPVLFLAALSLALPSIAGVAQAKPPVAADGDKKDKPGAPSKPDTPKDDEKSSFAVEVTVLHATNSKKGIDQRIGDMPELKKPPFSSYDSYELLSKVRLPLSKGESKTLKLPNGRVLQTKLLDILPKDYFRISASINKPGGKTFLPLLEVKAHIGQVFMVAGQSYKHGILVLVLRPTR